MPADGRRQTAGLVTTTDEEARAVRALAEARGPRSLIVVTDPFHTRRARLNFRRILAGTAISVVVRPVQNSPYVSGVWWKSADGLWQTWTADYRRGGGGGPLSVVCCRRSAVGSRAAIDRLREVDIM